MNKKSIFSGMVGLLASGLMLAACGLGAAPTAAPTVDTNAVYTQAAQTVEAGIQLTQAAKPPATETATLAPTNTTEPTAATLLTETANALVTPLVTATLDPALPTQTPLVAATATTGAVAPQPATGDKCEYIDQSPKDGTKITKDASWDMTYVLKNTGTTTWGPEYTFRFYAGDPMGSPKDLNLQKEVKPGEMLSLLFAMKAPTTIGEKNTIWVLQNPTGTNFCTVYLKVEITD